MMTGFTDMDINRAKWCVTMLGLDPHEAFHGYIEMMLIKLADSKDRDARYIAVAHKLLPEAKLVFMQNDEDQEIRAMVKARLEYGDPK